MARAATPTTIFDDKTRTADRSGGAPEQAEAIADAPEVLASAREAVLAAAPIQAKLVVGAVNDPLEAEADRMADAVVARIAASPGEVARAADEEELLQGSRTATASRAVDEEEPLQASRVASRAANEEELLQGDRIAAAAGPEGGAVDDDLERRLRGGGGAPLTADVRGPMEQAFGADFSAVRVAESAAANEIGARAYATGTDIRFAPGQYRPDTTAGQHLLAHELAHVVQQGGAGALHRDRADDAQEIVEGSTTTVGYAENAAGTVDDVKGAIDEISGIDSGPDHQAAGDLGVTGLASGILGLVTGLMNFYSRMQDGSTEDQLVAAHESLESAGGIAKGAIDIASAAGASIAGNIVPGIDLAFSLLSAVRNVGHLVYLVKAKNAQGAELDALIASMKGTDPKKATDDNKLYHALGNIQTHTKLRIASTAVKLGGDLMMAVGSVGQLVAGPFGTAVKLAGGLVKLSVSIGSALMQSYEAGKTADARSEFDAAAKSGDASRKDKATLNRLDNDAAFALTEIITQASYSYDPRTKTFDPGMVAILATYGISEKWLLGWVTGGRDPKKREQAEDVALRFIGAERDPKTIGQRIKGTLSSIWNFVTGGSKEDELDPMVVRKEAAQAAGTVYHLNPVRSGTAAQITAMFHKPVVEFIREKYNPDKDTAKAKTIDTAIDEALLSTVGAIATWIVPGTLKVKQGAVAFAVK